MGRSDLREWSGRNPGLSGVHFHFWGRNVFGLVFKTGENAVARAATHLGDPDYEWTGL